MKRPAVFFDRDGIINDPGHHYYVTRWQDFRFLESACDLVALARNRGWLAVLVTSQKGVGKGLMSEADLADIHRRMEEACPFDGIYAYTGADERGRGAKPQPDLVLDAAADLEIDLAQSWVLGDSDRDIQMGRNAGLAKALRVLAPGKTAEVEADETFGSVAEALAWFERELPHAETPRGQG